MQALVQSGKELAMNEQMNEMESKVLSQKVEGSELVAKAAWAGLMILVSLALIAGSKAGNMALSLVWPVLLLPILSAVKALCVLVCRVAHTQESSPSAKSTQGAM